MRPTIAQHDGCHRRPTHPAPPRRPRTAAAAPVVGAASSAAGGRGGQSGTRPSPPAARSPGPDETAPAVARVLPLSAQPHDKDLGTKYTFSGYVGVQTAANGPAGWTAGSTNHSSEMAMAVGAHSRSKEEADAPVAVHRPFRMYCTYPFKLDHTVHYMQYSAELYSTVCAYSTELFSL